MTKKNYIVLGGTILIFIIIILFILYQSQNKSWTKQILTSDSYEIYKIDCNNNQTKLDNNLMKNIDKSWKDLQDNGPWLGDSNTCYEKITISYDINDIIETKELLIIDNDSIVLSYNNTNEYYVNSSNLIKQIKQAH